MIIQTCGPVLAVTIKTQETLINSRDNFEINVSSILIVVCESWTNSCIVTVTKTQLLLTRGVNHNKCSGEYYTEHKIMNRLLQMFLDVGNGQLISVYFVIAITHTCKSLINVSNVVSAFFFTCAHYICLLLIGHNNIQSYSMWVSLAFT